MENKKIKESIRDIDPESDEFKNVAEQHGKVTDTLRLFCEKLSEVYGPIDVIFALGQVLDEGIHTVEEINPEAGRDLKKLIVISLDSEDLEEVMTRVDESGI